jgi:hypothetical protein
LASKNEAKFERWYFKREREGDGGEEEVEKASEQ